MRVVSDRAGSRFLVILPDNSSFVCERRGGDAHKAKAPGASSSQETAVHARSLPPKESD